MKGKTNLNYYYAKQDEIAEPVAEIFDVAQNNNYKQITRPDLFKTLRAKLRSRSTSS